MLTPPIPLAAMVRWTGMADEVDGMTDVWDGAPGLSCEGLRDLIVELLRADPRFAAVAPDNPPPGDSGISVLMADPVDLDFYIEVRTGY